MKNYFKFLIVPTLFIAMSGGVLWGQTTRYVPCGTNTPCYATIQAAITNSVNGDIIEVDAGTYLIPAGTKLIINKQVTLMAKAGLTTKPWIRTKNLDWNYCNVQIAADNVVVDGFEIDNALYGTQAGYVVGDYATPSGVGKNSWTIKNCNIHDGRNGVRIQGNNVTIEGNDIHGTQSDCINCEYGKCGGLKVTKNILHSEWVVSGSKPAGITYNCDATTVGDVEISYNICYASRTFIDFQHNGGTAPLNNILIMHNTVDWKMQELPSPITGSEVAQQMSIAFWGSGNWTASKFSVRDNIFSRQKWYEIVNTSGAGGPWVGSLNLVNNLFYKWYLCDAYFPSSKYPGEWPAARGAVGWDVTDAAPTFINDLQGDPLYKSTGTTPGEYYALTCASPAYHTATDGTNIGAWQGTLMCDNQPPLILNVVATPNPAPLNTIVTLTATVDDATTGNSNIASAEYSVNDGSWVAMQAVDGSFNSPTEDVTASLALFTEGGEHQICVRGTDAFGNMSASVCITLINSSYGIKQIAKNILIPYLTDPDKKIRDALEKAIKHIDKSLETEFWEDANHLTKKGNKVFDEEKEAVKELTDKILKKYTGQVSVDALAAINYLLTAGQNLAQVAIDEVVCSGDPKCEDELQKANEEMAKAANELAQNDYDKAIDHFKKAWEHAEKALKKTLDKFSTDENVEVSLSNLPVNFSLDQNYPNPFNPTTRITFDLPEATNVSLKVFNSLGQLVTTLISNENYNAGRYEMTFDASKLASGIYIYQFISNKYTAVKKMIVTK